MSTGYHARHDTDEAPPALLHAVRWSQGDNDKPALQAQQEASTSTRATDIPGQAGAMDWLQFARFIGPTLQVIQRYLSRHLADQQAGRSTLPCEYLSSCSDGDRTTRTSDFRLHQCTCCCTHLTAAGGPGGKHVVVRNEKLACPRAGSCSSRGRRHNSAPSLQHRAATFAT